MLIAPVVIIFLLPYVKYFYTPHDDAASMKRILSTDAAKLEEGVSCTLSGWLQEVRNLGGIAFLKVRDRKGVFQVVVIKKELSDDFEHIVNIPRESVITVEGKKQNTEQAELGFEILPVAIKEDNPAEKPLPLGVVDKVDAEMGTRFNNRFLDLRKEEKRYIFEMRSLLLEGIRDFFSREDFIEVSTPKIAAAGAEGGATLFKLDYYGKDAYLAQSPQLYKQMLMSSGFERIYEIAPAYRAEDFDTVRHTSEFISLDFEMSFIESSEDIMDITEGLVRHSLGYVAEEGSKILERLGVDIELPSGSFLRMPHSKCLEILEDLGKTWEDEPDVDTEGEKILGEYIKENYDTELYFITEFPTKLKKNTFYAMRKEDEKELTTYFDLEYKNQELVSGGQREHRYDVLIDQMGEIGLDPGDFEHYLRSFRYGMPPHGGIGLGLDRFIQQMLNLENIREGILFPRDTARLEP